MKKDGLVWLGLAVLVFFGLGSASAAVPGQSKTAASTAKADQNDGLLGGIIPQTLAALPIIKTVADVAKNVGGTLASVVATAPAIVASSAPVVETAASTAAVATSAPVVETAAAVAVPEAAASGAGAAGAAVSTVTETAAGTTEVVGSSGSAVGAVAGGLLVPIAASVLIGVAGIAVAADVIGGMEAPKTVEQNIQDDVKLRNTIGEAAYSKLQPSSIVMDTATSSQSVAKKKPVMA